MGMISRLAADAGELRGRSLSITFDDGYADNFTAALPLLEAF
jgi:peptidoglycan/xylan/chitin deacetylase (PgdA/CDA1 family)